VTLEPTYGFYQEHFKTLTETQFDALLTDAIASVNYEIFPRIPTTDDEIKAYRMAVCAVAERLDEPASSSWRVGGTSETALETRRNTVRGTIKRYLIGTNLLYKGL